MHRYLPVLLLICIFNSNVYAQDDIVQFRSSIDHIRMTNPPDSEDRHYSLADEFAYIVKDVLKDIWVYDIFVGVTMNRRFERWQDIERIRKFVSWAESLYYQEAAVIDQAMLEQRALSAGRSGKKKIVETAVTMVIDFYDLRKNDYLGAVTLNAVHSGGNAEKSRKKALKKLKAKTVTEMKRIFWHSADVMEIREKGLKLGRGAQVAGKGTLFAIYNPEGKAGEKTVPARRTGFSVVEDTVGGSMLSIQRMWEDPVDGSWVVEHPDPVFAVSMDFVTPLPDNYSRVGLYVHARPLKQADWGGGIQIIRVTDSFYEDDYGFGFNMFGNIRFCKTRAVNFGFWSSLDLDIPFKRDDDDQQVSTLLLSTSAGLMAEIPFHSRFDLIFKIGYRLGLEGDTWSYTEEEEDYPAFWWDDVAPAVNNTGIVIAAGVKCYLF